MPAAQLHMLQTRRSEQPVSSWQRHARLGVRPFGAKPQGGFRTQWNNGAESGLGL